MKNKLAIFLAMVIMGILTAKNNNISRNVTKKIKFNNQEKNKK